MGWGSEIKSNLLHIFVVITFHPFHQKSSTLLEGGAVAGVSSQGSEQDRQRRKMDLGGHTESNYNSAMPLFASPFPFLRLDLSIHFVTQAGIELQLCLSLLPKLWDHSYALPLDVLSLFFIERGVSSCIPA